MRRILAVGCAGLLAFTIATQSVSAADLGMPVKAPPIVEAPPPDYTWLWVALGLAALGVGIACAVDFCEHHGQTPPTPPTTGGNGNTGASLMSPQIPLSAAAA
jgi:hypothetical protein